MINVGELIGDPDFAWDSSIEVTRREQKVVNHKNVITERIFDIVAIVTISDEAKDEMREYASQIEEAIYIFSSDPLYTTGKLPQYGDTYLSDIVLWNGKKYVVMACKNWQKFGYCRSTAIQISQEEIVNG